MVMKNIIAKSIAISGILVLAVLLSACDRCGDFLKSEGGQTPLSCKSDGPKPQ
jgi:hypothetical protein